MQRGVTRVAAVVEEVVGRFVYPPDPDNTLRRRVAFTEMCAESALTIVHRLHLESSTWAPRERGKLHTHGDQRARVEHMYDDLAILSVDSISTLSRAMRIGRDAT